MADNTILDSGSGGDTIVTREISHGGDTSKLPGSFLMGISGSEGSYTAAAIGGDASNGLDVDVTRVSGTVTISGAVTNAGTFAVQAAQSGTWNITNVSGTVSLPTGAATAANQSTANTALSAIQTAVELLDNAVSGSELQVDVVGALPAGTNAIGKLAANSGVDIGDVDVTSVTPGTTAAALGKAEDAVHSSGDVGVFVLGVRRDSPTSGADTDGDYCSFTFDSSGRIWTNVGNTVTVTGTVTAAQATAANLNCTEASAATIATNTGNSATSLAILDDWDESDRAKVNPIAGQAGVAAGAGSVSALTQRVTLASDDPAVAALQILDNIVSGSEAQVDIVASLPAGDNNIGNVDVVTLPNVTLAAGTNTNEVVGDAAHGAGVAGNPLLVGLEGRSTAPTAVDDGDVVRALATLLGKQVHIPYALPGSTWSYATANGGVTDTADDEAKAAAASTRNYVTSVQVINGHATTSTEVVIKDGSTVLWRGWAQAAGGGVAAKFDPPLRGTANTAINVANITNSSQTYFNLQGFVATE